MARDLPLEVVGPLGARKKAMTAGKKRVAGSLEAIQATREARKGEAEKMGEGPGYCPCLYPSLAEQNLARLMRAFRIYPIRGVANGI